MGSGHFLVEAVDFITDRLLTFLNQFPVNPVSFMLDRTRRNILEALGEQGVTVDPDKLTEVNLLKRHVLKRCIYGVDLNPMAVELAKVSLWLDAFTLGAPLSFLDHHLRCGNSLDRGDVQGPGDDGHATGQLFGIDYEPLLRAIRHVIQVNKMADATAAEVKQSASEYAPCAAGAVRLPDRARPAGGQALRPSRGPGPAGARAATWTCPAATRLSASRWPTCGASWRLRARRSRPWPGGPTCGSSTGKSSSPRCSLAFEDADGRRIRHKDRIAAGSAGFDAVVGNPPYVPHGANQAR